MPNSSQWRQEHRLLEITTPLGKDQLLLVGLAGREAISEPFEWNFDVLLHGYSPFDFSQLLGAEITASLTLPDGKKRHFSGIVNRIRQGEKNRVQKAGSVDEFLSYRLNVIPLFALAGRAVRSRIFQQVSVPDILKSVLQGLGLNFSSKVTGTYEPRDYCVQYRESDFSFASRLMEEEGIFYFFKHTEKSHEMVVADQPGAHPEISPALLYEEHAGGTRPEARIAEWSKTQEIRAGKYTLWDYTFEMPDKNLEASKPTLGSVAAGTANHKLNLPANSKLEIYDYPGGYAERFDGVDPAGSNRSSDLQKIFSDNTRTAGLRMQEETSGAITIDGAGDCGQMVSGSKFTLDRHYSDNGAYVLTEVQHVAEHSLKPAESAKPFVYHNRFRAIPFALPFRPPRKTPIAAVHGTQTATVVGPSGEEIFTDKYGRVKVQFHWDREGQKDAKSSCWVRVSSFWAGKQWGAVHIPRVGQEVVVDFLEGNPNEPIIVGSVYNADNMPPYLLPDNRTQSGIKSRSALKGSEDNFNEFRFEDKRGSEQIFLHAEKDLVTEVENDETRKVDHDRTTTIKHDETKTILEGNEKITLNQGDQSLTISMGKQTVTIMGDQSVTIKTGNQTTKVQAGKIETEALQSIELKVGPSSVKLDPAGVTIKGMNVKIEGNIMVDVKGLMTKVNGDAMLTLKGALTMIN